MESVMYLMGKFSPLPGGTLEGAEHILWLQPATGLGPQHIGFAGNNMIQCYSNQIYLF